MTDLAVQLLHPGLTDGVGCVAVRWLVVIVIWAVLGLTAGLAGVGTGAPRAQRSPVRRRAPRYRRGSSASTAG